MLVALDTEVFVRHNFSFGTGALKRLQEFAEAGSVTVILPSVTSREVERKIGEHSRAAGEALRGAQKRAHILSTSPRFAVLSDESLESEFKSAFHEYCKAIDAEILKHDDLPLETILKAYFECRPPFEQGKKRHEFLDATAVEVLAQHAEMKQEKVFVVSGDAGVARACTERGLHPLESLDKLFDEIATTENSPEALDAAREVIESQIERIDELIETTFWKQTFELSDAVGDVDLVGIEEIEGRDLRIHSARGFTIAFEMDVMVHFEVDVSYEDHLMASMMGRPVTGEERLSRQVFVQVYGRARRSKGDPKAVDELDIELVLPGAIAVELYEDYDIVD
jgi:PIN domain-containing protein